MEGLEVGIHEEPNHCDPYLPHKKHGNEDDRCFAWLLFDRIKFSTTMEKHLNVWIHSQENREQKRFSSGVMCDEDTTSASENLRVE